tara:strand:+ start:247 stop:774 length:528 start_codon:yes stop_codon:yes gene_type:complete
VDCKFARLDENNIVTTVIVVSEDDCKKKEWWDPLGLLTGKKISEAVGISFCQNHCGDPNSKWLMTLDYDSDAYYQLPRTDRRWKKPNRDEYKFRGKYAGIGDVYMTGVRTLGVASTDIFINPKPYPSWHIGINTAAWYPPDSAGSYPPLRTDEEKELGNYMWDEDTTSWVFTHYN